MPHVLDAPLFSQVAHSIPHVTDGFDRTRFIEERPAILEGEFIPFSICAVLMSSNLQRYSFGTRVFAHCHIHEVTHIPLR